MRAWRSERAIGGAKAAFRHGLLAVMLAVGLAGCAGHPVNQAQGVNDPYEGFNRAVFSFNDDLDTTVAVPVATFYVKHVPQPARTGIHNVLANLAVPVVFGNDVLQLAPKRAGESLYRFIVNSSFGVGGIFDWAGKMGVPEHDSDFGVTLGVYGVGDGPYLVMPFIGPAPPRDLVGRVADAFMDPFRYIHFRDETYWTIGRGAADVLDSRANNLQAVRQIKKTSIDYYAAVRSLYRQQRNAEIHYGKPTLENLPDY
jgi:phospholipid-binding lipoprotein MlaA